MVASIAGAPPGSTVVRRAETLSDNGDGRSGNNQRRDTSDGEDKYPAEGNKTAPSADASQGGVTATPTGRFTVEGLLTLQEQPKSEGLEGDGLHERLPPYFTKSPY